MELIISLSNREETLANIRAGWTHALEDPHWRTIQGRFESNAFGEIIVSPPPTLAHNRRAYRIAKEMERQLGGEAITECPVLTIDGVKVADAAWFTRQRMEQVSGQVVAEIAPEICVEVISPRNTPAEMRHKRQLSFAHGARECWTCDLDGHMTYYFKDNPNSPQSVSTLCPEFPEKIGE